MGAIKGLAKDTAVYGLSSIIGRFLNWCLVPLYTHMFQQAEYGVVTLMYAVVALAIVALTYGLETGFFRFANAEDSPKGALKVYSTCLISLICSSSGFVVLVLLFLSPITGWMHCQGHPSYVWMMAVAVAADAFTALPFSYLRYAKRPIRFATLKLVAIGINIGLNLFFLVICPMIWTHDPGLIYWFYNPSYGIGYIFLSNFISSMVTIMLLWPELRGFGWQFDAHLWRRMMRYSLPLLVLGVAGIMNQTLDKILLPWLLDGRPDAMEQVGIYGANYKIAIVMVMFLQAYRFAFEPFIFARDTAAGEGRMVAYRRAMTIFVIVAMVIFMAVMFYLDILRYFIDSRYFSGLKVVPVIMLAELFFGVFFNLSVWYKLTDRTHWGMWFSLGGLAVTVGLNVLLVPRMGYMGCAWAALGCYGSMMIASWIIGRHKYPVRYDLGRLITYFIIAMLLYAGAMLATTGIHAIDYSLRTLLILIYVIVAARIEGLSLPRLSSQYLRRK